MTTPIAPASVQIPPTGLFIGGRFVDAEHNATFPTVDPATGHVLADVALASAGDVDLAVRSAREAYEDGRWSRLAPVERKRLLLRLADAIERNVESLALLEALDGGKLYSDTVQYDIPGTAEILRWYAEAADKVYGEVAPVDPSALAVVVRVPLGVIGAVVPWNYPLEMAMWKIAPALAAGNSVVLKPAENTPLSALAFAELCAEVGLPDGVFNVVNGSGAVAGQALGRHMEVDAIAFTGSTEVGKRFMSYAAESNLKQVWPECGGKSAAVVFADVEDLEEVADRVAGGIFFNAGQVCSASSRLLVERGVADRLVELLAARAKSIRVGDPLDPKVQMGPLVSDRQAEHVRGFIERAMEGAQLVAGGAELPDGVASAAFVKPTIFAGVGQESELFHEEVFGPVLAVTVFDDEDEAIRLANASRYGLAASLFTGSMRRAQRVSARLVAGTVTINGVDAIDVTVPFGGFKQSGFGRDLSLHALDKYTGLQTRWFAGA